jgi:integrase
MVNKVGFTVERVANFKCELGKQQSFLRDAKTPGLGLRVTSGGSRTYVFEARAGNRVLRRKIGDARTMLLRDAQDTARDLKRLTDAGHDPRELDRERRLAEESQAVRRRAQSAPALEAWQVYVDVHAARWSDRHKADHDAVARSGGDLITRGKRAGMSDVKQPGILRALLERPLKDITRTAIEVWVDEEQVRRPTRTRLALSLLSAFLRWCTDYNFEQISDHGERTEVYPYRDSVNENATARVKKKIAPPLPRKDCLQREQLRPWFDAVRRIPSRTQSAYLQILLLTGARRNELANLQWTDVDFRWGTLTIRDKVEGVRTIPLTPYVGSLLRELDQLNRLQQQVVSIKSAKPLAAIPDHVPLPWVFRSRLAASGRIQEPRIAHNQALDAVGLPPLTIHGLRRSFGTLAEWVECPAGIAAQVMGHKPSAIAEKHYRARPIDLLRVWHTKIETWILDEAGVPLARTTDTKVQRAGEAL